MGWFCVATAALQCEAEVCYDRVFFVATGLARLCRDTVFWCRDKAGLAGRCGDLARAIGRGYLMACCTVLCNSLNYSALSLFMNTVHGTVKKKMTLGNWAVTNLNKKKNLP